MQISNFKCEFLNLNFQITNINLVGCDLQIANLRFKIFRDVGLYNTI